MSSGNSAGSKSEGDSSALTSMVELCAKPIDVEDPVTTALGLVLQDIKEEYKAKRDDLQSKFDDLQSKLQSQMNALDTEENKALKAVVEKAGGQ